MARRDHRLSWHTAQRLPALHLASWPPLGSIAPPALAAAAALQVYLHKLALVVRPRARSAITGPPHPLAVRLPDLDAHLGRELRQGK